MAKINFFDFSRAVKAVPEFGLCDDSVHPAYVSYDRGSDKWIATVCCNNRSDYSFIPVDKNIITYAKNGIDQESSCDAMLHTPKTICFIELKDKDKDWLNKAIKQLEMTINLFKKHHGLKPCMYNVAYACNAAHPSFNFSRKEVALRFYQQNRVLLRVEANIPELK